MEGHEAHQEREDHADLDKTLGLLWPPRTVESSLTWFEAQDHCTSLTLLSRSGWRLPTEKEALAFCAALGRGETDAAAALPSAAGEPFWTASRYRSYTSVAVAIFPGTCRSAPLPRRDRLALLPVLDLRRGETPSAIPQP